jgi:hypothetical protein
VRTDHSSPSSNTSNSSNTSGRSGLGQRTGAMAWARGLVVVASLGLLLTSGLAASAVRHTEPDPLDGVFKAAGIIQGGSTRTAGAAPALGGPADLGAATPAVGIAPTPSGAGYWIVDAAGAVFTYGDAAYHGGVNGLVPNGAIVGIAPTPTGRGYWLVGADGGIFTFGDAGFYGSLGALRLNQPIVEISPTPSGHGYWLVASDGGIFSFGDAEFHGSTGAIRLNRPVVGMASTPTGDGYWLVADDGGIFAFGDAGFFGSLVDVPYDATTVDIAPTPSGAGYWILDARGNTFSMGDATPIATVGGLPDGDRVVAAAVRPQGDGTWAVSVPPAADPRFPAVPDGTGSGRRIVYSNSSQRVWLVEADGSIFDSYLVSGRRGVPAPGTYAVYSESAVAYSGNLRLFHMVRFAHGRSLAIGFHSIPVRPDGSPIQGLDELGQYRSHGCVRQDPAQAEELYKWADIGTTVVVLP